MFPAHTTPTPHNRPAATSHTACRVPGVDSTGLPAPARAAQTAPHTRRPTCTSGATEPGAAASAKNAFERHSNAAIWIALRTDVVGGCGDGAGKECSVGWRSAKSGSRSVGRNDSASGVPGLLGPSATLSTAMASSRPSSIALSSTMPSSRTSSSTSSSSAPTSTSGSGRVAHTPVSISRASFTALSFVSTSSRPSSVSDLWSAFGWCFASR